MNTRDRKLSVVKSELFELNRSEELIDDLRQGKMIVLMDDEDRENEGDLIIAANKVSAQDINFMAQFGRGLICLTLSKTRCEEMQLPLMVNDNNTSHTTNFTVSIDAATGVSTGISAADRAATIQATVAHDAKPSDLVQPGHVFPLMAQKGGVLTRAGHTEAGCDLARLAGFESASVIVEILNEDGSMARRVDLEKFSKKHGLKMGTIADLIRYRLSTEKSVERMTQCRLNNDYGQFELFTYKDKIDAQLHYVLKLGQVSPHKPTLVRVHMQDFLGDSLGITRDDCAWPLRHAMQQIADEGAGVILVLNSQPNSKNLLSRLCNYQLEDEGVRLPCHDTDTSVRTYGTGAQILADLGIINMRLLSAPKKFHGLSGFGLKIIEYVPCK